MLISSFKWLYLFILFLVWNIRNWYVLNVLGIKLDIFCYICGLLEFVIKIDNLVVINFVYRIV